MKLKQLLQEDDAVSPVIGVILMVAITVILAAVIATFVLGLGEQVSSTAPSTSFSFDLDEDASVGTTGACGSGSDGLLTVRHAGGPTIDSQNLDVTGQTGSVNGTGFTGDISAGDSADYDICTEDTVDITWEQEGDSAILATYRGPDA